MRDAHLITAPRARPLLRGMLHLAAFFLAIPALLSLIGANTTDQARLCAQIYGASLLAVLGISACYHRITWTPVMRARVSVIDHSAIFLLIAGTYTPIAWLGIGGALGRWLGGIIWAGAVLGILQTIFWRTAPRWLHVGIYVVLGWAGVFGLYAEQKNIGVTGMMFHVVGGLLYTLGALTYARKRPDPWPAVFGYHEVYHLLVLVACASLFEVVRRCLALGSVGLAAS